MYQELEKENLPLRILLIRVHIQSLVFQAHFKMNPGMLFYIVDNLLDERAVIWEYQGFRPETKFTNRPREFGLRLKYKF